MFILYITIFLFMYLLASVSGDTYSFPDGSKFRGQVEGGLIQGFGEWMGANGETYKGQFVNNLYHGEGTFTDVDGNA